MSFLTLIEAKRDGQVLNDASLHSAIRDFAAGRIPDYQMAAFLMAVYFRGLNARETKALTLSMRDSGEVLNFPKESRPLVDKHSTGGVGDKVSLPLAPLLACLGFRVPMISGRGLGITGGTLDKLESVPGFSTRLSPRVLVDQVQSVGVAMAGQTETMVPADQALYALRDVTGTVPSIPLITASILSKKLAENLEALVMDVKCGRAAFMQTPDQARALAGSLVGLARDCGLKIQALLTNMDHPLGRAAGNWLEIRETVDCLKGIGPEDLRELVVEMAARLLVLTGREPELAPARERAGQCLDSREPLRCWETLLSRQGADMDQYHERLEKDHHAPVLREHGAARAGYVRDVNALVLGQVVRDLGGGRLTKDTVIHPDVGVDDLLKPGEWVDAGAPLCRVHAVTEARAEEALTRLREAFEVGDEPPAQVPLLMEVVTPHSSGV